MKQQHERADIGSAMATGAKCHHTRTFYREMALVRYAVTYCTRLVMAALFVFLLVGYHTPGQFTLGLISVAAVSFLFNCVCTLICYEQEQNTPERHTCCRSNRHGR